MNGHQYEHQCAKRLKNKGFYKVTVTKGSGDQGIDVIAYSGGKNMGYNVNIILLLSEIMQFRKLLQEQGTIIAMLLL